MGENRSYRGNFATYKIQIHKNGYFSFFTPDNKVGISKNEGIDIDYITSTIEGHETLNNIKFTSNQKGFIVGNYGSFLSTEDSGKKWSKKVIPSQSNLNDIFFFNDGKTGFIVGDKGTLLKSIDSGNTWKIINLPTKSPLKRIDFFNNNDGIIAGEEVFYTNNGGVTWNKSNVFNDTKDGTFDLQIINEETCYITSSPSKAEVMKNIPNSVYLVSRQGKLISVKKDFFNNWISQLYFISDKKVMCIDRARKYFYFSEDFGTTWKSGIIHNFHSAQSFTYNIRKKEFLFAVNNEIISLSDSTKLLNKIHPKSFIKNVNLINKLDCIGQNCLMSVSLNDSIVKDLGEYRSTNKLFFSNDEGLTWNEPKFNEIESSENKDFSILKNSNSFFIYDPLNYNLFKFSKDFSDYEKIMLQFPVVEMEYKWLKPQLIINNDYIIFVNLNGTLNYSTDLGKTWKSQNIPLQKNEKIGSGCFNNKKDLFYSTAKINKTNNLVTTLHKFDMETNKTYNVKNNPLAKDSLINDYVQLSSNYSNHLFVWNSMLTQSFDGGRTWQPKEIKYLDNFNNKRSLFGINRVEFLNDIVFVRASCVPAIMYSRDKGVIWEQLNFPNHEAKNLTITNEFIYLYGDHSIFRTKNFLKSK